MGGYASSATDGATEAPATDQGGQQVADSQRVEQLAQHPLGGVVHCEMEPGDAVFIHGTTLHRSEGNFSGRRRLAFAAHFTREHNTQFVDPFSTGLNLTTSAVQSVPHETLLAQGLVLDSPEEMGLLDPVEGAKKTAKAGYEEAQEAKTRGEPSQDNYYRDVQSTS